MRRPQLCRSAAAEIGLDHARVVRRPAPARPAAIIRPFGQHVNVFGQAHHRLHDMLDHQDGDAAVGEMPRITGTISRDLRRVEPRQHLVEQQQLRPGGERARELEPLAPGDRRGSPPAGRAASRARRRWRDRLGDARARAARAMVRDGRRPAMFSRTDSAGERLHDLEGARDAARAQHDAARSPVTSSLGEADRCLRSGAMKPETIANSVVLPAPFGPISAVMRSGGRVERRGVDGQQPAEPTR